MEMVGVLCKIEMKAVCGHAYLLAAEIQSQEIGKI